MAWAERGAWLLAVLLAAATWPAHAARVPAARHPAAAARQGLSVGANGQLLLDGRPFRGVGVNDFSLFSRLLADPTSTAYIRGLRQLQLHHIPFVRFMATGFWPDDLKLLQAHPHAYWGLMRRVVQQAQRDRIGLIPDFFWRSSTVPDLVGEPRDQWGNPHSKTIRFMRNYVAQFVLRFDRSPAIWGYEFGNEYNLATDLPNWRSHAPAVSPAHGTPAMRTRADRLTSTELVVAYKAFAEEIRQFDPSRIIESGGSLDRISAWHQKYRDSWASDNARQYASMLRYLNPKPLDMTSVHVYPGRRLPPPWRTPGSYLSFVSGLARANGQPLFIGEFGVPGPATPASKRAFRSLLKDVLASGAPLAALWVYDDPRLPRWNARFDNQRAYQLLAVERADALLRAGARSSR